MDCRHRLPGSGCWRHRTHSHRGVARSGATRITRRNPGPVRRQVARVDSGQLSRVPAGPAACKVRSPCGRDSGPRSGIDLGRIRQRRQYRLDPRKKPVCITRDRMESSHELAAAIAAWIFEPDSTHAGTGETRVATHRLCRVRSNTGAGLVPLSPSAAASPAPAPSPRRWRSRRRRGGRRPWPGRSTARVPVGGRRPPSRRRR